MCSLIFDTFSNFSFIYSFIYIRNSNLRILHVSNHIATCARNCETPFKLFPLYKMKEADTTVRKMKESFFFDLFKPKLNRMF